MMPVSVIEGDSPIVLAMPHTGTWLPQSVKDQLNETGLDLSDTDWHIDQLYKDLLPEATQVKANFHRYVIDANRDPSDVTLYPGQNTTSLCPLTDFDGHSIYKKSCEPNDVQIAERRDNYHSPYHAALTTQLQRVKQKHGIAVLYDCHSIRSQIPFLFEGRLPDFNIGTFDGKSCDPALAEVTHSICSAAKKYTTVINARFKGGWTTRHYGQPDKGLHVVQMELSQRNYMQEQAPWDYNPTVAAELRHVLEELLKALSNTAQRLSEDN